MASASEAYIRTYPADGQILQSIFYHGAAFLSCCLLFVLLVLACISLYEILSQIGLRSRCSDDCHFLKRCQLVKSCLKWHFAVYICLSTMSHSTVLTTLRLNSDSYALIITVLYAPDCIAQSTCSVLCLLVLWVCFGAAFCCHASCTISYWDGTEVLRR